MRYAPSKRFGQYVRKVMDCGHWIDAERIEGDHQAYIRNLATGELLSYGLHDGGNDENGPRNMARAAQDICGCKFIEARGRKRSRRRISQYETAPRSDKAERKRLAEFDERRRREALIRAIDKRDRELSDIRNLMN